MLDEDPSHRQVAELKCIVETGQDVIAVIESLQGVKQYPRVLESVIQADALERGPEVTEKDESVEIRSLR
jgi:hypothetical protein